jgi:hypothetical protein
MHGFQYSPAGFAAAESVQTGADMNRRPNAPECARMLAVEHAFTNMMIAPLSI